VCERYSPRGNLRVNQIQRADLERSCADLDLRVWGSAPIIIYSVRDHLLPRIAILKTTYEMYDALKNMLESNNTLKSLTLKNQLQHIKMTKANIVATFFMKILEIRD
jgi:hypothetical protein